jgi:hypothetical protein
MAMCDALAPRRHETESGAVICSPGIVSRSRGIIFEPAR